jgi:hypothetical protein
MQECRLQNAETRMQQQLHARTHGREQQKPRSPGCVKPSRPAAQWPPTPRGWTVRAPRSSPKKKRPGRSRQAKSKRRRRFHPPVQAQRPSRAAAAISWHAGSPRCGCCLFTSRQQGRSAATSEHRRQRVHRCCLHIRLATKPPVHGYGCRRTRGCVG